MGVPEKTELQHPQRGLRSSSRALSTLSHSLLSCCSAKEPHGGEGHPQVRFSKWCWQRLGSPLWLQSLVLACGNPSPDCKDLGTSPCTPWGELSRGSAGMGHPGQNRPSRQCQDLRRAGCGEPGLRPGSGRARACVWLWHSQFEQGGSGLSAVQGQWCAHSPSACSCCAAPQLPSPAFPAWRAQSG